MKTIIDAVNELKGCWPSGVGMAYVYYCHGRWFSSDFPTTDACFCKYDVIACIKECSNNFGNPTTKKESLMIEFNLERALAGDKVVTRNGEVITQLVEMKTISGSVLYGYCRSDDSISSWLISGKHQDSNFTTLLDLFMAPKPLSGFVNLYSGPAASSKHASKALADQYADNNRSHITRIACIDLSQHNEGEGLE